jgi:DNA-binding CsgD family transcriptional regulator
MTANSGRAVPGPSSSAGPETMGTPVACFLLDGHLCHVVRDAGRVAAVTVLGRFRLDGRPFLVVAAGSDPKRTRARLARREREIAWLVAEGLLTKQIAHRLGLSPHTVGAYVNRIYARLGCHNRAEMVAVLLGLVAGDGDQRSEPVQTPR